jgi:hypothetical protein
MNAAVFDRWVIDAETLGETGSSLLRVDQGIV